MLRGARIPAEWVSPPSAAEIRQADNERMLAALLAPVEAGESDTELAARLMAERSPEEIAVALIQAHRARMPEPEELLATDAPPPQGPRPGFEGSAWFRINIGRRQNADPRWILPLLCRRGHVSRSEIGAIRITANECLFEVPGAVAARFLDAVQRTAGDDDGVEIVAVEGNPRTETKRHGERAANQSAPRPAGRPARDRGNAGHPARDGRPGPRPGGKFKHRKGPPKRG
jgi:ATP-dependent RNA helicase DeaD